MLLVDELLSLPGAGGDAVGHRHPALEAAELEAILREDAEGAQLEVKRADGERRLELEALAVQVRPLLGLAEGRLERQHRDEELSQMKSTLVRLS